MPLIEIIADSAHFFVSEKTLNNNPTFLITQLFNKQLSTNTEFTKGQLCFGRISCDYVDIINMYTYRIDIDPKLLANIINELRGVINPSYVDDMKKLLFVPLPLSQPLSQPLTQPLSQSQTLTPLTQLTQLIPLTSLTQLIPTQKMKQNINENTNDYKQQKEKNPSIFRKQQDFKELEGVNRNYIDFSIASDKMESTSGKTNLTSGKYYNNNDHMNKFLGNIGGDMTSSTGRHINFNSTNSINTDTNTNTNNTDTEYSKFSDNINNTNSNSNSPSYKDMSYDIFDALMKFQPISESGFESESDPNINIITTGLKAFKPKTDLTSPISSKILSDSSKQYVPKGHNIFKSRKIEFNTSNETN